MNIEIQKQIDKIRRINPERNYWFIRTYGGKTYDDFIEGNYVGLGFYNVPNELIENTKSNTIESFDALKDFIDRNTPYKDGQATRWTNQLKSFHHKMKPDDIVIIPDKNSDHFHIGIVDSNVYLVNDNRTIFHDNHYVKYPDKRRRVIWQKEIGRQSFQTDLTGMTNNHQAIFPINHYADRIEGNISSLFIKNNAMNLVISVNQDEDINAFDLKDFLDSITYFYKEFCEEEGIELNRELYIKVKIQSRGKMALAGFALVAVFGIAAMVALSNNPEFEADLGVFGSFKYKGQGVWSSYSDFLDRKQERRQRAIIFHDSIQRLKADGVKDSILNNQGPEPIEEEGEGND